MSIRNKVEKHGPGEPGTLKIVSVAANLKRAEVVGRVKDRWHESRLESQSPEVTMFQEGGAIWDLKIFGIL